MGNTRLIIRRQGMYAGIPDFSGMRGNPAVARIVAKQLFSDMANNWLKGTLQTGQNVRENPCRIDSMAGNLTPVVSRQNFPGFRRTSPLSGIPIKCYMDVALRPREARGDYREVGGWAVILGTMQSWRTTTLQRTYK